MATEKRGYSGMFNEPRATRSVVLTHIIATRVLIVDEIDTNLATATSAELIEIAQRKARVEQSVKWDSKTHGPMRWMVQEIGADVFPPGAHPGSANAEPRLTLLPTAYRWVLLRMHAIEQQVNNDLAAITDGIKALGEVTDETGKGDSDAESQMPPQPHE